MIINNGTTVGPVRCHGSCSIQCGKNANLSRARCPKDSFSEPPPLLRDPTNLKIRSSRQNNTVQWQSLRSGTGSRSGPGAWWCRDDILKIGLRSVPVRGILLILSGDAAFHGAASGAVSGIDVTESWQARGAATPNPGLDWRRLRTGGLGPSGRGLSVSP
jgi:autotransporter translocation and assembly factor TamB